MADTIAVMNRGKVEQLGSPSQLYESPETVFVANFLGQSNLIRARVTGRSGADLLLDVNGSRLAMPSSRFRSTGDDALIGVRPEKVHIVAREDAVAMTGDSRPTNSVSGVITDASFTGVSTQYLVRTAWDQELTVFAQNLRLDERLRPGAPVVLQWEPANTFGLDAAQDIRSGAQVDPELDVSSAPEPARTP